jgi:hypothetical protein
MPNEAENKNFDGTLNCGLKLVDTWLYLTISDSQEKNNRNKTFTHKIDCDPIREIKWKEGERNSIMQPY